MDMRTWLDITTITATHCCVCRAELTDALSLERGLGPICSAKHYKVEHEITSEMVEVALGVIFASGLDKAVKLTAKHMKDKPREFCNVLVKWASAHYDQREVVFEVADAIEAFGFVALAAKLREDRTKVHLRVDPNDADKRTIHTGRSWQFDRYLRRVPGAEKAEKVGRYEGWSFPAKHEAAVLTIVGHLFPDQWATLINSTGRLKAHSYYEVQQAIDALYPPKVLAPKPVQLPLPVVTAPTPVGPSGILRVSPDGKTLEIRTPKWNGPWLDAFKTLVPWKQRSWTGSLWTCPISFKDQVAALVRTHYQMEP